MTDADAPVITRLEVRQDPTPELVPKSVDTDTHAGWVTATSTRVQTGERRLLIRDRFCRETVAGNLRKGDGTDDPMRRVPAGRYFLVVSDGSGRRVGGSATIVR